MQVETSVGSARKLTERAVAGRHERPARMATVRHYLMCPPEHFDVVYSINPWMDPAAPVDPGRAMRQWQRLRDTYVGLGHTVDLIEPLAGLPDMVFSANGATVLGGRVLLARFRHAQRAAEAAFYCEWFRSRGYRAVRHAEFVNEGEGDYIAAGDRLLAGTGFRTDRRSHAEARRFFRRPVVTLELVDPRYYHLDTALAVLGPDEVMYYPAAFSARSRRRLRNLFPDAILATDTDAAAFGLNAVCDGRHVVLPAGATRLAAALRERGFEPVGVDVSELLKAGGGVKCCTLELRGASKGADDGQL